MDEVIREYIRDFWSPSPPATVGFVGIGYMGSGMVKNLAKGGFKVAIANRTIAKAEAVAATLDGAATVFATAGEVAAQASIISVCTASEASGEAVITELIAASKPGHILLDHSTVSPAFTAKMHAAAAAKGVVYLDAPISGGPEGAANGTVRVSRRIFCT
jgi:3-hydroxyisobutyrate dehydrogenase